MTRPRLALREKCAQMIFADFRFDQPDYERIVQLVKDGIGGVCFFGGSIFDVGPMVNSLQRHARIPLLICSDYEHGVGHQVSGATVLPTNMAVGATGSEELARLKGRVTAAESKAFGVPWVLAPVLDVNANPLNPIINTRSFGQDPALVSRLARAYLAGLHEGGAIGCGKHFPGHGDVTIDSHLELPVLETSVEKLRETELRPYADLAGELDGVMPGHLKFPALDPDLPASLSKPIVEGLLRRELRFEGLVCTDALMMGGITRGWKEKEALELSANAGCDALLYPCEPGIAIGSLEDSVKWRRLDDAVVDRAVERLLGVKEKLGLFEDRLADVGRIESVVACDAHRAAAQRIADASVTLVRGGPVKEDARVVRISDESARGDLTVFEREIKSGDRGRTVVAIFFKQKAFAGKTGLPDEMVAQVRHARPDAVVSFGSPYVIHQIGDVPTYVCAYGESEFAQIAAARALRGEIPFQGKLPVSL